MTAAQKETKATQVANAEAPALDLTQGGQGWRPKKGAEVRGILRAINRGWSDWANDYYPILTIESDDGALVDVHCFHSVLFNRVMATKPRVGEYVGVKFHGQEPSKDGKRTISLYSFDVSRPDGDSGDPYGAFEAAAKAAASNGGETATE